MKPANSSGTETVRGVVHTWECDAVEHFTTGAYFRKLGSSTMTLLKELGIESDDPSLPWTTACRARFRKELAVGDVYHVEAGVVAAQDNRLTIGHRLFNSETGELCTTFLQELEPGAGIGACRFRIDWDEDDTARQPDAEKAADWLLSSASIVRCEEVDWSGRYDLGALVSQMSAANIQSQTSIGMTPSYMRSKRRGYSTAEYLLRIFGPLPGIGTALESRSAVVHVGRTSVWFMHELYDRQDNRRLARLGQLGVHLDLDARRPCPLPEDIRERAIARVNAGA